MAACSSTTERNTPGFEAPLGQFGNEALDGVEPRGRCGGEVESPARASRQPGGDLGMFVGGIVVDDGMDQLAGRHGSLDSVQEADELLMAMALHSAADHAAIERAEGGEQGGGAMPLVVVRHAATAARDAPDRPGTRPRALCRISAVAADRSISPATMQVS